MNYGSEAGRPTHIDTVTTWLEMHSPTDHTPVPCPDTCRIEVREVPLPTRDEYLSLYRSVGDAYHWVDRIRMPAAESLAILNDPQVTVLRLEVDGAAAGFAELDGRVPGHVELAYFGVFPQFQGRGFGKYFLSCVIQQAWERESSPDRVWVHTCDLDHPAVLPNYEKAGFSVYQTTVVRQPLTLE